MLIIWLFNCSYSKLLFIHFIYLFLISIKPSQELDLINEENVVYKLIGPALIRQDLEEARQNVSKRVDYIQQEM